MAPPAGPDRWILHVDMDAFFASVEAVDDPSLAGRPLIVGGTGRRGVVASCSYEARVFGVRSAMPSAVARRLCPDAVFVPGRYDRYAEISRQMHAVFARFTPLVEGISLDEAFLDVTGAIRLLGPVEHIARSIRDEIAAELRLGCSVGAAPVKFLAKLASEAAKPGPGSCGVFVVYPGEELAFLHPLPIGALWGVGPATERKLRRLGINTIGDLARTPPAALEAAVGKASGAHLSQLSRAYDPRDVVPDREVKSVSHEETYAEDLRDRSALETEVLRLADGVAHRLHGAGLTGRTVTLKVRYGDFSTITRSATAPAPVDTAAEIAGIGRRLLASVDVEAGIRLLGVGVSNLVAGNERPAEQLAMDLTERAPGAVTAAVDAVRRRFGAGAVGPAALVSRGRLQVKRPGDSQWGPAAR